MEAAVSSDTFIDRVKMSGKSRGKSNWIDSWRGELVTLVLNPNTIWSLITNARDVVVRLAHPESII